MRNIVLSLFFALCLLASCTQPIVEVFGSISGYVVDEDTGEAVAGARVAITPVGLSQVTAVDGEFLFDNLDAQEYTLSIKKDGYQDMSQKVSVKAGMTSVVQVALKPIQPVLKVEPSVLDFGDESSSLALDITNAGKGTLEWTIEEDIDWLTCTQQSGSTSDKVSSIVVKASREGLGVGSYSETIVVSSNGGSAIVKVKLSVGNSIKISVEPKEIDFGAIESDVELIVKNNGITAVKYTASSSNQWLTLSKSSSSVLSTDYLHAIVSREGLAAGSYTSSVVISTEGGDLVIPVKMEVAAKSAPIVTLENVDDITYSSAVANGTIVSVGSSKVFRYGFCISAESKDPTVDGQLYVLGDSMEPKSFSALLTNLESNKTYYVRSFAENQEGIAYSNTALQFTTADLPKMASVSTGDIISVETNSAVVLGSVDHLGNVSKVTAYGHVWNTTGSPTLANGESTDHGELATTSQYSSSLEGLEVGTKYYVRAYATNEKGTSYGSEQTFTTNFGTVELRTSEATDITHESAVIEGEVVSDGRNEIVEKGVVYSKSPEPDRYAGKSVAENGFTCTLTGLSKTTTYYARAYAKTSEGKYFYGNEVSFTTAELVTAPTVSTGEAEQITENSAVVSGSVDHLGNVSKVTAYGHVWNTTGSPTLANGESTDLGELATASQYSSSLEGLEVGTKYYVRAYATNEKGTSYGSEQTFTTNFGTVELRTSEATDITHESAVIEGEVVSDGRNEIVEKGVVYSKSPEPDRYAGKSVAENGFTCTLTGLSKTTTYYARAYAKTSEGKYFYGNEVSFTTKEIVTVPTVSTGEAENITEKSVEVSGNIVSTGYSTVTEYGHVLGLDRNINKDGSYLWKTKYGPIDSQTGFTSTFNQLEPNTMYYVRAYATNDQGTVYGDVINFKTDKEPVVVVTGEPAEITINSARLSAEILYSEGHVVVEKGFIVWPYGATGSDMEIVASSAFEATVDGLHDNTQYMVQAYVKTSEGRVYYDKDGVSFTTIEAPKNPTNGLYAYYTFENDTKNTVAGAVNASGINVSYVDGKQGTKALKFTTKDALLNVPEPLIDGRDFTISFWVKDLNDGHIFDVVSSGSYKNSNVLAVTNGRLRYIQSGFYLWRAWNDEEDAPLFTHSSLSSDWHHIVITSTYSGYSTTDVCLYLNGEYVDKVSTDGDDRGTGIKFVFGGPLTRSGYSFSLNWIAMTIDNLRIYNSRVLTAEEVKQIYEYEK